ncbi:MAG: DNA-processing protein DprA [Proteobacteria bacterium]|nr:DNA-processing protein DprA [Pseudomonadota bacterium]
MPTEDLLALCTLAQAPTLTAEELRAAVSAAGSLPSVTELREPDLVALGWRPSTARLLVHHAPASVEAAARAVDRLGLHMLSAIDPRYPPQLLPLAGMPGLLFVRGRLEVLVAPQIAIVGSRRPTALGRSTAREFACSLACSGLAITSGLALGIDAASHEGALAGGAPTLGVCATGLDLCYPPANAALSEQILEAGGALLSEFQPGTLPLPHHFPQRNRIISGLSLGVLVVEAALKSGSLITARYAGEQGRAIFAIPGSIHSTQSRGCHQLLRQGAVLVECARDIFDELRISVPNQLVMSLLDEPDTPSHGASRLDNPAEILLDAVGFEPTSADALIASTGLSSSSLASLLLALELEGRITCDAAGRYRRLPVADHDHRPRPTAEALKSAHPTAAP